MVARVALKYGACAIVFGVWLYKTVNDFNSDEHAEIGAALLIFATINKAVDGLFSTIEKA